MLFETIFPTIRFTTGAIQALVALIARSPWVRMSMSAREDGKAGPRLNAGFMVRVARFTLSTGATMAR
jgi:hypothetical protein